MTGDTPRVAVLDRAWSGYLEELRRAGITATGTYDPADLLVPGPGRTVEVLLAAPDLAAAVIHHLPQLRWVQSTWAGVEPLLAAPLPAGVAVTRAVDVFGPAMREFVLGYLLAHRLRIHDRIHATSWDPASPPLLMGSRMGILGTGSIGSAIAAAASGMGIQVVGLSRSGRDHPAFHRVYPAAERLAFAEGLDHLVAVLPATPATSGFVDAGLLARLTPGATFINVGRGSTVDLEAVIAALNARRLSLAVLDVLEEEPLPDGDPLWLVPGLVITSHTAATSVPSDIVRLFAANLERFRTGGSLRGAVDPDAGY